VILLCLLAAPFADPDNGYSLELSEGWTFAPQAGVRDPVFRTSQDGVPASFYIRVTTAPGPQPQGDGFRLLGKGTGVVAGQPAIWRRFVADIPELAQRKRMVVEWRFQHEGRTFLVHVESLAEALPAFEAGFQQMLASLRVADVLDVSGLLGHWRSDGQPLQFRADGTFSLGALSGTFVLRGRQVITYMLEGAREVFDVSLQQDVLTLTSTRDQRLLRFERGAGASAPDGKRGP
jgi:hypothetical protein